MNSGGQSSAVSPQIDTATAERILTEILAEHVRHITEFGHTAEADLAQPIHALPIRANQELRGAIDYCSFHRLPFARRYLIKTAAVLVAAIARIDSEPQEEDLPL